MTRIVRFDARHQFLDNERAWFAAIEDDYQIVGLVSLDFAVQQWPWINDLIVAPDRRREGIGSMLLNAAEMFALESKAALGCNCAIDPWNKTSRAMFENRGYRHVSTYPDTGAALYSLSMGGAAS